MSHYIAHCHKPFAGNTIKRWKPDITRDILYLLRYCSYRLDVVLAREVHLENPLHRD